MGKSMERVKEALKAAGATLKRDRKHRVYELPNGRTFVIASTPSDSHHAEKNALGDLRRALGEPREAKAEAAPRERRKKPGRNDSPTSWTLRGTCLAEAMRESGVLESKLRADIDTLENQVANLRRTVFAREARIAELERSWPVRLAKWFQ